jgi:hypothetical protein
MFIALSEVRDMPLLIAAILNSIILISASLTLLPEGIVEVYEHWHCP